jgi:predicted small lipoprotein YifL
MLLFALSQVVSCGQKGDLYLPDEQQSSISPATLIIALLA